MKKAILYASLIVLLQPSMSSATERYFSLETGTYSPQQTTNQGIRSTYGTGWSIGGIYGLSSDFGLRAETELIYRQATARSGGNLWSFGWLVNLWYDVQNSSPFTPYLGGGFGFGSSRVASPSFVDNSGSGVAYQAGGGVDYSINRKLSLDVGYRYYGIADTSNSGGIGSIDQAGSSVTAGLRFKF